MSWNTEWMEGELDDRAKEIERLKEALKVAKEALIAAKTYDSDWWITVHEALAKIREVLP